MKPSENRGNILGTGFVFLLVLLVAVCAWAKDDKRTNSDSSTKTQAQQPAKPAQQPAHQQPQQTARPPQQQPVHQTPPPTAKPPEQRPRVQPPAPATVKPPKSREAQQPPSPPMVKPPKSREAQQPPSPPTGKQTKSEQVRVDKTSLPDKTFSAPSKVLSSKDSGHQIKKLNHDRKEMPGINRNPLPKGQVTLHPDGHKAIVDGNGRQFNLRADGTISKISLADGRSATYRPNGKIASVHTKDIEITHGVHGSRIVRAERPDHTRIVSMGRRYGFVERPVTWKGREYVRRTYVVRDVTYTRVYRTYVYNHVVYERYVPAYYYAPKFYGWAYYPWRTPVMYTWGWLGEPWHRSYGSYFAPYQAYPNAYFWLTDFMLAQNLQLAYQADQQARADNSESESSQSGSATPLSPEIKQEIAEEVKQELAAENTAASSSSPQSASGSVPGPSALDPQRKIYIVGSILHEQTADGTECQLTAGDILRLDTPVREGAQTADLHVVSNKQADCQAGQQVTLSIQDLEDMHNQFEVHFDDGLKVLASNQGKNGLPPAPPPNPYESDGPPNTQDSDAVAMLGEQQQQADQAETQVQRDAFGNDGAHDN